jgi:hypothetical protein
MQMRTCSILKTAAARSALRNDGALCYMTRTYKNLAKMKEDYCVANAVSTQCRYPELSPPRACRVIVYKSDVAIGHC